MSIKPAGRRSACSPFTHPPMSVSPLPRPKDESADARARLSQLIADSGLSIAEFGRTVLGRDERTVRRWLTANTVIPDQAADWLARAVVTVTTGEIRVEADEVAIVVKR